MTLRYDHFEALTFDCYGTLIDWESGLLTGLRRALPQAEVSDDDLLEAFARYEHDAEHPYQPYRAVLAESLQNVASELSQPVSSEAVATFSVSVRDWPAFADSAEALARLKRRFKLGVITNCDTDLFAASNEKLGIDFDWVVTAEMAGSYKPDHNTFEVAFSTIDVPRERILHVAQSLFHDHVPAKALGLTSVWIDRRHDQEGSGATPPAQVTPDATFPSMKAFADEATA
ncbi:MAG: haloacid dehalogenase type II [Thermomicrobiales bacterium]